MHYLAQIVNQQVAFSVKQQKPNNIDAAVSATLQMESYMCPKLPIAKLEWNLDPHLYSGGSHWCRGPVAPAGLMKQLIERMEKLEAELAANHRKETPAYLILEANQRSHSCEQWRTEEHRRPSPVGHVVKKGHTAHACRMQNKPENYYPLA